MTYSVKTFPKLLTNIPGNLKHRLKRPHLMCFHPKIYNKNKIKTELHELTKGCIYKHNNSILNIKLNISLRTESSCKHGKEGNVAHIHIHSLHMQTRGHAITRIVK